MMVYFAHATSFCGSVWNPVISELSGIDCVTWDFAGHGSGPTLDLPADWHQFGSQVLEETKPGGIGVGHSMGAAALTMAQLADPDRFRFLLLIEPIIFPGPHQRVDHMLSAVASKRKRTFESRSAARDNFASRGAFVDWVPSAIDGYVECGLVGDGPVELACDPEVEADAYRASNAHDTWERLGEIDIPVLILAGEESDTTPPEFARQQATQFSKAGLEILPEAGHFLPMTHPGLVADRVRRLVETFL
jgi:pimeloyl-ACP methyl ester carboxylesterase